MALGKQSSRLKVSQPQEEEVNMRYLEESDCKGYCDYYPVCVKFGKVYREGCVLDGERFQVGVPKDPQVRRQIIARLQQKLAEEKDHA